MSLCGFLGCIKKVAGNVFAMLIRDIEKKEEFFRNGAIFYLFR